MSENPLVKVKMWLIVIVMALVAVAAGLAFDTPVDLAPRPLIIGHRGASGHRPEHTIEGYTLAIQLGADAIEPDLVSTKDGVLIARHENEIGGTTDVASKFPGRKTTKTIEGHEVTGWFTEDFTLAEIKTLRANERLPFRSHKYDGKFLIPTFEEIVQLAARKSVETHRAIAVYPETKHPAYFRGLGLALEERLVTILKAHGLTKATDAVYIQSFEADSLKRMRPLTGARLVQLLDVGGTVPDMREIAQYADGLGPNKRLVVPVDARGLTLPPTDLVLRAHRAGLFVHVWTMASEREFLSKSYEDPEQECRQFAAIGVDGMFTDFPGVAARALALPVR
jgi:glycerophosphoryl diester phosphodiesterase